MWGKGLCRISNDRRSVWALRLASNPLINWYRIQMDCCCPLWIQSVPALGWFWPISLRFLRRPFVLSLSHSCIFRFFVCVNPFSLASSFSVQWKSKDRDRCEWWHPTSAANCVAHRVYTQHRGGGVAVFSPLLSTIWSKYSLNRMTHQWSIQFHCPIEKIPLLQSWTKRTLLNDRMYESYAPAPSFYQYTI